MRISRTITAKNRAELMHAVELAPLGAQVELSDAPRTVPQNKLMWRLLSHISDQVDHCGDHYDAEAWKCCFLRAMGKKLAFMPSLDGNSVVAIGYHSSRLSKEEMSDMIEMIFEFGARHGVDFEARQGDARQGKDLEAA